MNNNILVLIDGSYFLYYTAFGAVSQWTKQSKNASIIKSEEETDQKNLPDLTMYPDFCRILQQYIMKRFDTINWLLRNNIQEQLDTAGDIDIIFALDSPLADNWRKEVYPQYKAQRKLKKKTYDIYKIINYCLTVLFPKLNIEQNKNISIVKIPGAEGDDIIATILTNTPEYQNKVLIASDHDFLQIASGTKQNGTIIQIDLMGKIKKLADVLDNDTVTADEYIMIKSIVGDISDNIPGIFTRFGVKKTINLVRDNAMLVEKLSKDSSALYQLTQNKKIIDFKNIPAPLSEAIMTQFNGILKNNAAATTIDLSDLMDL